MKKTLATIFFVILILFTLVSCNVSNMSGNKQDDLSGNKQDNLFKKNHTITLIVDNLSNNKITVDDGDALVINSNPQKENYLYTTL